jgi:hypothetical protein
MGIPDIAGLAIGGGRKAICLLTGFLLRCHGLPDAFFFCRVIIENLDDGVLTSSVPFPFAGCKQESGGRALYLQFEPAKRNGYYRLVLRCHPILL